jgi:hypothetical protein
LVNLVSLRLRAVSESKGLGRWMRKERAPEITLLPVASGERK